ncbi:MAG: glycosyl transferase family protein [Wenzhouxiangellaceae bacterium]|nr:glycosyl transferase family protein [Wenzhouxiangellaceae bacterium]
MFLVDLTADYLLFLKYVAIVTAVLLAVLGLDDLFLDIAYWIRRIWRALTVYRKHKRADVDSIMQAEPQPIVIMVPAWQESSVIGEMIEAATRSIDYENYHIVIGTYPNDPDTQQAVDRLGAGHPNVHRIVCARPGPTNKADCLNNIVTGVFELEKTLGVKFAGFVLHDAEDVIPGLGLRIFNFLLRSKDLIQLPVYPLPRPLLRLTGGHYVDEFAEQHAKDVVMREALAHQVPSAGVGTCFSRRALLSLMRESDALPFDIRSLTEDYDIAIRLSRAGMKEVFVRFPNERNRNDVQRQSTVVAVREYFPDHFGAAVRQKSRWITGIVFQGMSHLHWANSGWMNYFLWRDRRGLVAHPVSFLATFLLLNVAILWFYELVSDNPWRFVGVFAEDRLLVSLLIFNGFLLANRLLHRIYFVSVQYGIAQGLMSVPRALWSNVVNFVATGRAALLFFKARGRRTIYWDKTTHEFPEIVRGGTTTALGKLATDRGWINDEQLEAALTLRRPLEKLGQTLLRLDLLTARQLSELIAEQAGCDSEAFDPRTVTGQQLELLPGRYSRKYGVFPLRMEGRHTLVVGRESAMLPMQVRALERRAKMPVKCVIVPQGTVTVALRINCSGQTQYENPIKLLEDAVADNRLDARQAEALWHEYVHRQVLIGDILLGAHVIAPGTLHQALIGYEKTDLPLGRYLVENGYLAESAIEKGLEVQREFQPTMQALIEREMVESATLDDTVSRR